MSKAASEKPQALEEVTLLKAHTHQGEDKQAGDKISVHAADKAWLVDNEIIEAPAAKRGDA